MGDGVFVRVKVKVAADVLVPVGVRDDVGDAVREKVGVAVRVCVKVGDAADVFVRVGVPVYVGDAVGVRVRVNVEVPAGDGVRVNVGDLTGVGVHKNGNSSRQSRLKSNVIASFVPFCICIFCIICNTVVIAYNSDDHVGCVKLLNGIAICDHDVGATN